MGAEQELFHLVLQQTSLRVPVSDSEKVKERLRQANSLSWCTYLVYGEDSTPSLSDSQYCSGFTSYSEQIFGLGTVNIVGRSFLARA